MKRAIYIIAILTLSVLNKAHAQERDQICRIGLQYQISTSSAWGKGQPVIFRVEPSTPAAAANLKPGDIIESIDGRPTMHLSEERINALLQDAVERQVLEITNTRGAKQKIVLGRDCKSRNTLTEEQLAKAFSLYSLEDQTERRLTYPFTIYQAPNFSLSQVKSFAFAASVDHNTAALDDEIYRLISSELNLMGLREDNSEPDVIIDCFYSMEKNRGYSSIEDKEVPDDTWRYVASTRQIERQPYLPIGAPERAASHLLSFGFRMLNTKNTDQVIWQCTARELLSKPMSIPKYAEDHVKLMLMQFPFVRYTQNPIYLIVTNRYYKTGISLRANMLSHVADVASGSPADRMGIKPGDRILSINGIDLKGGSPAALSSAYEAFFNRSMKYRDNSTLFTDANGLKNSAYWRKKDYNAIAKLLEDEKYMPAFAYLYYFRPYTNREQLSSIVFEIENNGQAESIIVQPVMVDDSYVTLQ